MSGNGEVPHEPSPGPGAVHSADPGAWRIYRGTGRARPDTDSPLHALLPPPPPWRTFDGGPVDTAPAPDDDGQIRRRLGGRPVEGTVSEQELDLVNAALFLRRPLIVTGPPGTGKSSLAYRVSRELGLGRVLTWSITSRSTLKDGLYGYDAIGRVQEAATIGALQGRGHGTDALPAGLSAAPTPDEGTGPAAPGDPAGPGGLHGIGEYLQLGPLGTAMLPRQTPRVLLIDEFDKSDVDLANDLLSVFEEGEYRIPELERVRARLPDVDVHTDDPDGTATVSRGRVRCAAFPFVVITSNGERAFPPAFLRRCLWLDMPAPGPDQLAALLAAQFGDRQEDGEGRAGEDPAAKDDGSADGAAAANVRAADGERTELIRQFLARAQTGGTLAADQLMNSEYLRTTPAGPDQATWQRLLDSLWRRLDEAGPG